MRAAEPRASFLMTNTGDVWSHLFRLWKTSSFCFSPVLEWTLQSSYSPCNTASLRNAPSEERRLLRRRWRYNRLRTKRRKVAPTALTLRASSKLPINQRGAENVESDLENLQEHYYSHLRGYSDSTDLE